MSNIMIPVIGKYIIMPLHEEPVPILVLPCFGYDNSAELVTCWDWCRLHFGLTTEYVKSFPNLSLNETAMLASGYSKLYAQILEVNGLRLQQQEEWDEDFDIFRKVSCVFHFYTTSRSS